MLKNTKLKLFISIGLFLAVAPGCTRKNSNSVEVSTASGKKTVSIDETLRLILTSEPPTLDWSKSTDIVSSTIIDNVMEGLVGCEWDQPGAPLVPALATSWEAQDKGKRWIFRLRNDVKWTDGVAFEAKHVIDSWQRLLAPETASEYGHFLFSVKNAKAYREGQIKDFNQVGVKAKDATTIEVELDKPVAFFPYLLTYKVTYPIRLDLLTKHGTQWTEAGKLVTLGPYRLSGWTHDKDVFLERNESYYGAAPGVANIHFHIINESNTAQNLFDSGKVDAVTTLSSLQVQKLKTDLRFRSRPGLLTQYLGFNTEKAPFDRPLVRKAIAAAIDKNEITRMLGGGQQPANTWIPPGLLGFRADAAPVFNPEKAKALLKEAGYGEGGKPFPKVQLMTNTNEDYQRVIENVQAQLKRNLGIDIEIQTQEWKVYLATTRNDPPPMFRMGWATDYPDPDGHLNIFTSYSENNRPRWKNKRFDELIEKGAGELNQEVRKKIYEDAEALMAEDAPIIPTYYGVITQLVAPRVSGFPLNPFQKHPFKGVRLGKKQ